MVDTQHKPEDTKKTVATQSKIRRVLHKWAPKTRSAQVIAVSSALLLVGVVAYVVYDQVRSDDIVVGNTRITTQDRNDYSKLIEEAKKENPNLDFGGKAGEVALNDLLLNAAFKQEAKERNQPLTDEDLIAVSGQEFATAEQKQSYIKNVKSNSTLVRVRAENEAYKQKFNDALLAKKDLLIAGITFDSPFFNRVPLSDVQNLYKQSLNRLNTDIQPLMKSGASKEEIAKKVDVNLFDDNNADDVNPQPYFEKPVATIDLEKEYSSGTWEFNDLKDDSYIRGDVGKLYDTDKKIAELKNVGDTTGVFSSKMGRFMTIRLEKKSAGVYNSWDDFLNHYKSIYGKKSVNLSKVGSVIQATANVGVRTLTSIGLEKAQAQGVVCAEHKVKIVVRAYDVTNNAYINNATKLRMDAPQGGCASSARTVIVQAGTGSNTINDNCFTPVPSFSIVSHPNGYNLVAIGSDERNAPNQNYNLAGIPGGAQKGLPDWKDDALNGKTVYTTFYYNGWKLDNPVSQVNTGSGWSDRGTAVAGTTVHFRHYVKNNGPATADFMAYREFKNNSSTWNPGENGRHTPGDDVTVWFNGTGGVSYQIPTTADPGTQYCQRVAVQPPVSGGSGTDRSDAACVTVITGKRCEDTGTCPAVPNFDLSADCRDIRINNLLHPPPNQNRDVAIRVRVYPNNQGGGIVIDQNGNPQGDGNYVFRTHGSFDVKYPSGYGSNIGWRIDVRAFALNHVNENRYSSLVSNYQAQPCPSWDLTPSTDPVPGFVEQGGSVGFNHYVTNNDPFGQGGKTARNINTCVISNYNVFNANSGITGEACSTNEILNIPFGTNGPMGNNGSVLSTNANTPRGTTYCQRYRVSPVNEFSGGTRESGNACTVVVGGTSSVRTNANKTFIEPTEEGKLTATVNTKDYSGGGGWPGYTVNCSYTITANGGTIQGPASCGTGVGGNGDIETVSWPRVAQPSDIGTEYCLNVYSAGTGNPLFFTGQPTSKSCFKVIARPYFKVYGGDVAAGCAVNNSSVVAWNKNGGDGSFNGAGASLAVFAQDTIRGFASGQTVPSSTGFGTGPTNLSFGNSKSNDGGQDTNTGGGIEAGGVFGGNLKAGNCASDYFGGIPPAEQIDTGGWPGVNEANRRAIQTFVVNGNLNDMTSIAGELPTVTQGSRIRLYVKGDVFISKDILPSVSPNNTIENIPTITIVARNIYISPNVGQLYGTYVAQPIDGSGGNIYTCASALGNALPVTSNGSNYNTCKQKQLVFTGSVVAKKIHLLRTWGSLYQDGGGFAPSSNSAAGGAGYNAAGEIFRFNPLVWQRQSTGDGETDPSAPPYDAITTLPASL